jgi:hypothetical protein
MKPSRLTVVFALVFAAFSQDAAPVPAAAPAPRPAPAITPAIATASPLRLTADSPVLAAAGDIACNSSQPREDECHHKATSDLLVNAGLAKVLALGDTQYEIGRLSEFRAYFHPTWGRVKKLIRPAPGNHEYDSPGAWGYYTYFRAAAGPRGLGYYSFDLGTWHIIALNSNCSDVPCHNGSAQVRWLVADLAAHSNTCTLAFWHHPRWSSGFRHGGTSSVAAFWDVLYAAGAEVVLNGHEHNYERFAPQNPAGGRDDARGIREFVVGTGGRSLYEFGSPKPNSQVRHSGTFGVLRVRLHASSYEWRFVPEKGKSFKDSGSTNCH